MTTQQRGADRVYLYACELAAMWRPMLADGKAVGLTAIALAPTASDEVKDEHGGRVLDASAAIPMAVEMLSRETARQVELVFPVAIGDDSLGWGVRYAEVTE